jgi:2-keto-3-deoxy-6-phosphogluconate aldolase
MDIQAIGQGFGATEVQFNAVSDAGKAALQAIGGGFACIGMTVRKSSAGDAIQALAAQGVSVSWVD